MQRFGGVSRYFVQLILELRRMEVTVSHGVGWTNNKYLLELEAGNLRGVLGGSDFPGRHQMQKAYNRCFSTELIKAGKFNVFHPTYYNPYFIPLVRDRPYVITVYDMIYARFPSLFRGAEYMKIWMNRCVRDASAIIAISESTRSDFLNFHPGLEDRVHVVHLASSFKSSDANHVPIPARKPYLLFVGGRTGYKNFDRCLLAFAQLVGKYKTLTLVAAGGNVLSKTEIQRIRQLGLERKVIALSASDDLLASLYANALALVYPSIYEGFGLPIVEAFSFGCPVVTSNTSAMPEIAGDAALYFDPLKEESISETISKVIEDERLRKIMAQKSILRGSMYSWQQTGSKTLSIYSQVRRAQG